MTEQGKAHRTSHLAGLVAEGHPHDHEGLVRGFQQIEEDGFAGRHHLPHEAVGNEGLDLLSDGLGRIDIQEGRIPIIDPDHPRLAVYDHRAFTQSFEAVEHGLHGFVLKQGRILQGEEGSGHGYAWIGETQ